MGSRPWWRHHCPSTTPGEHPGTLPSACIRILNIYTTAILQEDISRFTARFTSTPSQLPALIAHYATFGLRYTLGRTAALPCPERMNWCVAWSIVQQLRWFRGGRGGVRSYQVVLLTCNDGRRPIILTPKHASHHALRPQHSPPHKYPLSAFEQSEPPRTVTQRYRPHKYPLSVYKRSETVHTVTQH